MLIPLFFQKKTTKSYKPSKRKALIVRIESSECTTRADEDELIFDTLSSYNYNPDSILTTTRLKKNGKMNKSKVIEGWVACQSYLSQLESPPFEDGGNATGRHGEGVGSFSDRGSTMTGSSVSSSMSSLGFQINRMRINATKSGDSRGNDIKRGARNEESGINGVGDCIGFPYEHASRGKCVRAGLDKMVDFESEWRVLEAQYRNALYG